MFKKIKKIIVTAMVAACLMAGVVNVDAKEAEPVNLGEFKITYYWPGEDDWGYQTASGVKSCHLYTVAVDPDVIPLGSVLMIDGWEYLAVDVGGAVKGNVIDIFSESPRHETYHTDVEIVKWGKWK